MKNTDDLKAHYDSLETNVLLEAWSRGGQIEWAEKLLADELKRRDVPEETLAELAMGRERLNVEIANQQDRIQTRVMGGGVTMILAVMLASIVGRLFGGQAALITVAILLSGYGTLLLRMMKHISADVQAVGPGVFSADRSIFQIVVVYGMAVLCIFAAFAGTS